MTFGQWRQRLRVLAAIELLSTGSSVTRAALQVGYHSPSAFVAAFRRALGTAPAEYMRSLA